MKNTSQQKAPSSSIVGNALKSWGGAASLFAIAGAVAYNWAQSKKAERDTPPIGRFIEVEGVRLHYLERGSGAPIVLLHGNGATIQDYLLSGLVDELAADYRVIAFDRPGFGYSDRPRTTVWTPSAQAELIFKTFVQLNVERPIVVGHSWAALAALAMALDHPKDIAALVLLSGYYFPTARPDTFLLSPPAVPVIGDILRYTISPLAGQAMAPTMFETMFWPDIVPENISEWPLDLALRPSQIRASAADTALMVPAAAELSLRYKELALPVLIVGGQGDKIANFNHQSAALHEVITNSEAVCVEEAGHMVHYTALSRVVEAIHRASQLGMPGPRVGAAEEVIPPATAI